MWLGLLRASLWLAGAYCFLIAGRTVHKLRGHLSWSDIANLDRDHYDSPEYQLLSRKFRRYMMAGIGAVVAGIVILVVTSP